MDFIQKERPENSGFIQLLMLIVYAIAGILIGSILAFILIFIIYGKQVLINPAILTGSDPNSIAGLQILMIATSAGLFLAPPLFLALTEGKRPSVFYGFKKPEIKLIALVFVIMTVSMPLMEWVALLNQKMVLPESLKELEHWMREKEDEAMRTTFLLLKMNSIKDLLINLFMIALLPGIAEELMFRGGIQRSFTKIVKNPHVAIWISAVIFSAIHFQFYGFFPRLLLGAGFGYLYFWSGSLWYAMFAHFLNNGYAVCAAWYMQKNNIPLSELDNTASFTWYGYVISFVLTILVFLYFKNKTQITNERLD
ncbi:CPBP family intramembrane glutamic endopeptidase [Pedobacter metabolipauper]|uniref:CAAX prenyl protease 2/Lysostaphin resistance protein A-like domain-containing protein n=1 Tax=Pedobacter metabolipauper TaxID=425513 RepID=A0A4V3D175_9SPHI|nr:CPBP family intramembrane glutamic endopeptidase [Pedobacter metabolipauper]TDQ09557.1 hypothetical protein ATK78_1713 [Pedobacter metabolipauper]